MPECEEKPLMEPFSSDHDEKGRTEEEVGEIGEQDLADGNPEKMVAGLVHEAELDEEAEQDISIAGDDPDDDEHPREIPCPRPQEDREEGGHCHGREARHQQYGISGVHGC